MIRTVLRTLMGMAMLLGIVDCLQAQVNPEIQLAARGVMSFNVNDKPGETTSAVNDFSDSGLLTGFRQKLYSDFRGQLVIGFQFPDANSSLGQVFFHQVFILIENKSHILKMGRSRIKSSLIEFPTLRDDDAIFFTDVLNPFSAGDDSEDNQYGNVLELTHIFGQRYWLTVHGERYRETPIPPAEETDFSLNGIGLSFQYTVPQTQTWNRQILSQVGVSFNNFLTDRPGDFNTFDSTLKNIIVSTVLNIRPDPVHFWDLRHQTIYNLGFSEVATVTDNASMTRARSLATFTSLRYLYRKLERPAVQVALSFGYKTFPDLEISSSQYQVVANAFYRLGSNFDAGVQVQYIAYNGDLRGLFGESETRFQVGLVYSINQVWNDQFDDRYSLLSLEHGYIP